MIERLRLVQGLNDIIIASTSNVTDEHIAELGEKLGVNVWRGSENEVLGRYESPLFPKIKGEVEKGVIELGKHFLKIRKMLSLNFHPAPLLEDNRKWGDISHGPATLLGPWVSNLIAQNGQNSK
jgi:hypothetical protein